MTKTLRAKIRSPFSKTAAVYKLIRASRRFEISDGRYTVRLARNAREMGSALALRHRVFNLELRNGRPEPDGPQVEFDEFDLKCRHLIVIERSTGKTVGTYRISSIESAKSVTGFYSFGEFTIEDLPTEVINNGMEIGRACIAPEHRNTKVLFLLWRGLATYLQLAGKRYFFGCCSIFSEDPATGRAAYRELETGGHFHESIWVEPRRSGIDVSGVATVETVELPPLFNMYLRIGAKVCSPPMVDREFGTIDFFVVFDLNEMSEKYRKMFIG